MRHRKHNHQLGVKTAHRSSLLANLSCSLIENGRIKTTLAKARALRPSIEKAITLAKKAHATDDAAQKVHYRRLAIARLRSKTAVKKLFDELAEQFVTRNGGYTRIYKLALPRLGDAAEMALIEFVEEAPKKKAKKKKVAAKKVKPSTKNSEDEDSKSTDDKPDTGDAVVDKPEASLEKVDTGEAPKPAKTKKEVKQKESSESEDSNIVEKKKEEK
jgi:large subunit ribosomal protein L17